MNRADPNAAAARRVETVVIGAGQAGLAASYHLAARGLEHVVLERGRVGETWRSQRWDGFFLNTPNWAQRLPGFHYRGPEPDAFAPLREVIGCLEEYAGSFGAPVREGIEVTRVRRDGTAFVLETNEGAFAARHVVVASGAYQRPAPTPLARAIPPGILQLHTSEYRRPGQVPEAAVVVVGSGASGCQIAEELLDAGRDVYLAVGRCPWAPRRYRGHDVVHWLVELGLADQTVDTLPSPMARLACNIPVSGNDGGRDCNPRWLARRGVTLMGRIEGIEGGRLRIGEGLEQTLSAGDEYAAAFKQGVDEHVARAGLDAPGPEPEEPSVTVPRLTELDLRDAGVGTIVWATGFRPDHGWIDGLETDPQGWPIQKRGVTSIPGLYFVGLHWLHKRKSALFLGVGEDAESVVAHLAEQRRPIPTR